MTLAEYRSPTPTVTKAADPSLTNRPTELPASEIMPFTPTHVAAVVPIAWLAGGRLPLSALAIGSMVCDVPVFFPWLLDYAAMHSPLGILTHGAPVGLLAYFVFHALLKRPLATLLPRSLSNRLVPFIEQPLDFSLRQLSVVTGCIVLGASTHVIWDAFTHEKRWGVEWFPVLNSAAVDIGDRSMHWYELLQHGSSIVFLPLLVVAAWFWLRQRPQIEPTDSARSLHDVVVLVSVFCLIAITFGHAFEMHQRLPGADWVLVLRDSVRKMTAISITLTLVYCLVVNLWTLRAEMNK